MNQESPPIATNNGPKEEVASLERIAQRSFEYLDRKQNGDLVYNSYEKVEPSEILNRLNALKQIVGELSYFLGFKVSDQVEKNEKETHSIEQDPVSFWSALQSSLQPTEHLLDLGSGVRPTNLFNTKMHICVDLFQPYLEFLREKFSGRSLILINEDVISFLERQPSSSIETIFIADLIEHLNREEGFRLIEEVSRVASLQVIVFTPNGFMEQHVGHMDGDGWGWNGNTAQTHKSGWTPKDFPGWKIIESPNHHLQIEYKPGAFAAVLDKKIPQKEKIIYLICPSDSSEAIEIVSNFQNEISRRNDAIRVKAFIHPALALGSFNIHTIFSRRNWDVKVSVFNPEIRKVIGLPEDNRRGFSTGIFGAVEQFKAEYESDSEIYLVSDRLELSNKISSSLILGGIEERSIHFLSNS
jgi:hypothetical protein